MKLTIKIMSIIKQVDTVCDRQSHDYLPDGPIEIVDPDAIEADMHARRYGQCGGASAQTSEARCAVGSWLAAYCAGSRYSAGR